MSVETEFRALLAADSALVSLVGTRIAQNVVPQDTDLPLVVFAATHNPTRGLDGTLLADEVTFIARCWAEDGVTADSVADAIEAALTDTADVVSRATVFHEELQLDGVELTIQWFDL